MNTNELIHQRVRGSMRPREEEQMGNILEMLGSKGTDKSISKYNHNEEGPQMDSNEKLKQLIAPAHGEIKETIISPDAEIKGSIKFKDSLRVDGSFEGQIDSQGTLFIGKSGTTKAEIHVGNIIVEGKSEGNITCEDKIELRSTAKIFGDITATRLTIAEGVNIIGKCSVSTEKPSPDTFKQERHGLQDFKKMKEEKPQIEKIGVGPSVVTK